MPFTPEGFAKKLRELRASYEATVEGVAEATGIEAARLSMLESGSSVPTGDEILIVADHFGVDFQWLADDEAPNPEENVTTMFRLEGNRLSAEDRYAVRDFIHLCKTQALVEELLEIKVSGSGFKFTPPPRRRFIDHGLQCASAFRAWHGLEVNALIPDVFDWFRKHGLRVFRRAVPGSSLSGLFVDHPEAGRCILINSAEDIYRQRFSAGHEVGHALMDNDRRFNVSDARDNDSKRPEWLHEVRASTFSSAFLMPPVLLRQRGTLDDWRKPERVIEAAEQLWVTIPALLSALVREKLMDEDTRAQLHAMRLRLPEKRDPELEDGLTARQLERKRQLLAMGLHGIYVEQCINAHRRDLISLGKLAEAFLVQPSEVAEVAAAFGHRLAHG